MEVRGGGVVQLRSGREEQRYGRGIRQKTAFSDGIERRSKYLRDDRVEHCWNPRADMLIEAAPLPRVDRGSS